MSGIDLNRAGTPLLEIVTEPDMRSAAEAVAYAKKLHELVQWIDICDGNMQEGSFRCDVNVSVRPKGTEKLGTRREIKNLNSFKFMTQAIEYETRWQIETLEDGGKIHQATVLFNPDTGETKSMRSKEEANDYRYFPDPDLLPLEVTEADKARVQATMPELPEAMKARFEREYGLSNYDATTLTRSHAIADYFIATLDAFGGDPKLVANWVMGDVFAYLNKFGKFFDTSPLRPRQLANLLIRIADETILYIAAKEQVFPEMCNRVGLGVAVANELGYTTPFESDNLADEIIEAKGLKQKSDSGALEAIIDAVLAENPAMVAEFKAGKEKAFNALVGQCMKASKRNANPAQVNEILKKKLVS
jgi:aspartyl-tRNA(Asn)/glutamyl-tRNA(Gln) amidotransferase subunit B